MVLHRQSAEPVWENTENRITSRWFRNQNCVLFGSNSPPGPSVPVSLVRMRSPVRIRPSAPLKSCKFLQDFAFLGWFLQDLSDSSCNLMTSSLRTIPKINQVINFEGPSRAENACGTRALGHLCRSIQSSIPYAFTMGEAVFWLVSRPLT